MRSPCLLLLALGAIPALAAVAAPPLLPGRVEQAIHERIAVGEYPAMVVAVVDGDRSHVYAFGKLDDGRQPDADTIFQIGSITKTFTATLLAEAVESGKLKLDTPVAKLLPDLTVPSRDGKPITLGELAMQVSGLPRLPTNMRPANPRDPYADYDAAKLKTFLATYKLPRDPGASYEYSNLGFGVLGYAFAQHTGTTYAGMLQSRILEPLDMTSTTAALSEPLNARWAMGHGMDGQPAAPWHLGVLGGSSSRNREAISGIQCLYA